MLCVQPWRTRNGLRIRAGGLASRFAYRTAAPARLPRARAALLWRRPRRFGRHIDPAPPAQAVTLRFALHLNLMLNKPAGTRPVRERIAGGPTASTRDGSAVAPGVDRETQPRLKLLRDYLLGMAAQASTPRESASARSAADASSRAQAVTLQFSHRLNALLNMMIETRQNLQRIASVLPGGPRAASAFNPGRRNQAAPPLTARRDALLGLAASEDTPRRFFRSARYRVLNRSNPAPAMALPATRWSGEVATRPGEVALAETRLSHRRDRGVALAETRLSNRRNRRSRPFRTRSAEQTPSWPAALGAGRPAVSETPRRVFRRPVERTTLTEPGRRKVDQSHQETIGTQPLAPITLAWRRAPDGHAAPSASMAARTSAAHAVMPATSPRDVSSALNARMPRQAGTQFDSAMMNRLTHEVIGRIEQKMRIERERRGL